MSVWTTSLVSTQEVVNMLLDKYRVECPASNFCLFIIKDNGGNYIHQQNLLFKMECKVKFVGLQYDIFLIWFLTTVMIVLIIC